MHNIHSQIAVAKSPHKIPLLGTNDADVEVTGCKAVAVFYLLHQIKAAGMILAGLI